MKVTDKILIITPFRNEEHSIPHYLKSLLAINYPKNLIDVYWLENDSTDKTSSMLKSAKNKMPFNSTTLESVNILGPLKKKRAGSYYKDLDNKQKGRGAWLVIWNKYFLPLIKEVKHEYVLFWYADAVPPPNVIAEYMKVFKKRPSAGWRGDVGWVGGRMHRRFPRHNEFASPRPIGFGRPRASDKTDTMEKAIKAIKNPTRAEITMHVFMIPRKPLCECKLYYSPIEMHFSIIDGLAEQGLRVYYQPTVYIKHVSTDGKIWIPEKSK